MKGSTHVLRCGEAETMLSSKLHHKIKLINQFTHDHTTAAVLPCKNENVFNITQ